MRVSQRVTHLPQQVERPVGRNRPEAADERFEVASCEQLHHVIKDTGVGRPEVEHTNGMRGAEGRRGARLPLEPLHHEPGLHRCAGAQHFRPDQLDGDAPGEHAMLSAPDFTHAAVAQQLRELVAAHLARAPNVASQSMERPRRERGHDGARVVRHEQNKGVQHRRNRLAAQVRQPHAEWIHRGGDDRRRERPPRRRRRSHRIDQYQNRDPRKVEHPHPRRRRPAVQHGDEERVEDHRHETDIGLRLRSLAAEARIDEEEDREHNAKRFNQFGFRRRVAGHGECEAGYAIHHEADRPKGDRHRRKHRQPRDLFVEQIVGEATRGQRAPRRARRRRLHARLDRPQVMKGQGLPITRNLTAPPSGGGRLNYQE